MACTCEDALSALSARLGLPLHFDGGTCALRLEDQPFSIRHDADLDRLVLSALVADDLPAAPSRQLVGDLLDLGFGLLSDGLPAVARDPETGFLAAFAVFPLATLSPADFPDAFEKFAAFATALADRLAAERDAPSPAPSEPLPPPPGDSFIPV